MSADVPLPFHRNDVRPDRRPQSRRPTRTTGRRRSLGPGGGALLASRIVLVLIVVITLMTAVLAVGMRLDDRQIEKHPGTATATVLSVSALRTGIEFVDGSGVTVRPPNGVLYPGRLVVGQRFMVEYSTLDPTVVRVAGRTAAVGNLLLGITLVITWLLGAAGFWWLRRSWRDRSGQLIHRSRRLATGLAGSTSASRPGR